jgi:hypothetical protein
MSFFAVVVYLMAPYGVIPVCVSVALYQVTVVIAVQLLLQRLLGVPVAALIVDVGPALVSSLVLFGVAYPLTELLNGLGVPAVVLLAVVSALALGLYALVMRLAFRAAWEDLMLLLRTVVPARLHVQRPRTARMRERLASSASEPR